MSSGWYNSQAGALLYHKFSALSRACKRQCTREHKIIAMTQENQQLHKIQLYLLITSGLESINRPHRSLQQTACHDREKGVFSLGAEQRRSGPNSKWRVFSADRHGSVHHHTKATMLYYIWRAFVAGVQALGFIEKGEYSPAVGSFPEMFQNQELTILKEGALVRNTRGLTGSNT